MTAKKIRHFLLKLFSILAFIAVSGTALFFAYGYQPDLSFRQIKKTSIIHITPLYEKVRVSLDGQVVSEELPYQMKGILPGLYTLTVESPLFLPWQRKLQVYNDFVTKVDDVLLFPRDPAPFMKTVSIFLKNTEFYWGKNFFVVKRSGQDYITLASFFADGTLRQQEVKLARNDIQSIDFLPDQNLLIHFAKSKIQEVVLTQTGDTQTVNLPEGIQRLMFDQEQQVFFFLWQGSLWKIPRNASNPLQLSLLGQPTLQPSPSSSNFSPLLTHVDQFTLSPEGIYFLRNGQMYRSDDDGQNIHLIDDDKDATDLAYISGHPYGFMVVRKGDRRFLYELLENDHRLLLSTSLSGDFLVNDQGDALFVDVAGEIFFYSQEKNQKIFLSSASKPMDPVSQKPLPRKSPHLVKQEPPLLSLVGWLNNDRQFLFRENGVLKMSDLHFDNVYTLSMLPLDSKVYAQAKALYFFEGLQLQTLILP